MPRQAGQGKQTYHLREAAKRNPENLNVFGVFKRDGAQRVQTTFSYPDYTVGSGITPDHAQKGARGLSPPVGNYTLPRRYLQFFVNKGDYTCSP